MAIEEQDAKLLSSLPGVGPRWPSGSSPPSDHYT